MRGASLIIGAVGVVLLAGAPCAAENLELPPGPGRDLVYGQCRTCHDLQYLVDSAGVPRDAWAELLDSMKQYGLRISADQRARILEYLGTYLGPNPPPTAQAAAPAIAATADGAAVFKDQCAACHRENGQGVAGQFPPLARNADLFLSPDYPARVLLFGLSGKIEVNGATYDGAMPPLDSLSDQQIAAVLAYVRDNFGNAALAPKNAGHISAATVAALRAKKDTKAEHVYEYRQSIKAQTRKAR